MHPEFHIFTSDEGQVFTLQQEGLDESQRFASLGEATRHLRDRADATGGYVVIHDEDEVTGGPNRIPLHIGV